MVMRIPATPDVPAPASIKGSAAISSGVKRFAVSAAVAGSRAEQAVSNAKATITLLAITLLPHFAGEVANN
jgi:hypothetical protein